MGLPRSPASSGTSASRSRPSSPRSSSTVETLGAACLALGLLTRFWALCMVVDMVVAIWRAVLPRAPELELLLLVGALALLSLGAGPLSIDRLLQKKV